MAIDISSSALLSALRLGSTSEETSEAQRLLSFATQTISDYLGDEYEDAPPAILNEAVIRLCGYLFDQPYATRGSYFANALRNSGAGSMLLPHRVHRGGNVAGAQAVAAAQQAVGTAGNPVVDVNYDIITGELVVSFQDGTTQRHTLVSGQAGVDQDARDSAAAAQNTATAAATAASAAQSTATTNTAALAALPSIPSVPPVYTSGNNDRIPKDKITSATADQYLVISNTGNIIGVVPSFSGGGGASVITRERLIFPASSYVYQSQGDTGVSGGITTLSIAYPTDTDQEFWKGKLKTAFVAEDPDVASLVIGPMVEARSTTGEGMYTSDEKIRLSFDASEITLTIFGMSLAVNQRNSWFVWLVGV